MFNVFWNYCRCVIMKLFICCFFFFFLVLVWSPLLRGFEWRSCHHLRSLLLLFFASAVPSPENAFTYSASRRPNLDSLSANGVLRSQTPSRKKIPREIFLRGLLCCRCRHISWPRSLLPSSSPPWHKNVTFFSGFAAIETFHRLRCHFVSRCSEPVFYNF